MLGIPRYSFLEIPIPNHRVNGENPMNGNVSLILLFFVDHNSSIHHVQDDFQERHCTRSILRHHVSFQLFPAHQCSFVFVHPFVSTL